MESLSKALLSLPLASASDIGDIFSVLVALGINSLVAGGVGFGPRWSDSNSPSTSLYCVTLSRLGCLTSRYLSVTIK